MYNPSKAMSSEIPCRRFSFDFLKKATGNFAHGNLLGTGGFGSVYRGSFLEKKNGTVVAVAVKRLSEGSKQGDPQFQAEIEVLSSCHHRHIVPLIGYCDEMNEKILVYEYVPGGSLFHHLHRSTAVFLTMEQRLEICLGVARGLDHLHSGCISIIIHRDVKTANILVDENWTAKISDLGLAKVARMDHPGSDDTTKVIRGTPGYIDLQYVNSRKPSTAFDVYAFGVVLLEVLSRRRALAHGQPQLVDWALPTIKKGDFNTIIEPNLIKDVRPDCLQVCVAIIAGCLEHDLRKRYSMSRVVADLVSALSMQRGTNPSSSLIDSGILNHFNKPHLDTISETEGGGTYGRNNSRTNASNAQRKQSEIYLPGVGDRIVLYYTSLRGLLKIHDDCEYVRLILSRYGKWVDERDLCLDPGYREEIRGAFGGKPFELPQLFIRGNHVGGVDEIRRLHEVGELEKLLRGFPAKMTSKDDAFGCRKCGNARFVGCSKEGCNNGSCGKCNAYGLVRCPDCSFLKLG